MSAQSQFDREEEDIQKRYGAGEITNAEMWQEQFELQRGYQGAAEEAVRDAAERERANW